MKAQLFVLGLIATLAVPATASAQRRMPHTDAGALGAEVGMFIPKQDGMGTSAEIAGFYEHYLSARDSVRAVFGWANPGVDSSTDQSVREIRVAGELIHNWEGGAVHPFLGAGLGAYFLQRHGANGNIDEGATKLGGTLIAGVEYFTSKTFSIKGEGRYNVVSDWNAYNPSGLTLTIGVKSYF